MDRQSGTLLLDRPADEAGYMVEIEPVTIITEVVFTPSKKLSQRIEARFAERARFELHQAEAERMQTLREANQRQLRRESCCTAHRSVFVGANHVRYQR